MRRIREILRQHLFLEIGQVQIAKNLGISPSTVNRLVHRATAAKLSWPLPEELSDTDLERLLYPPPEDRPKLYPEPDWGSIHMELKRKGVTLILLWQEYKEQFPTGYQLSQFCDKYRQWKLKLKASMRQVHRAGDKAFSDFAGTPLKVTNPETGEVKFAYMFISALGASNNTFADVFLDQSAESWCDGQASAFRFWGGVPKAIVPDNAGGAVPKPCRYEPEFGAYGSMAQHFGCVVLPARVAHPKDKAYASYYMSSRRSNHTSKNLLSTRVFLSCGIGKIVGTWMGV